MNILDCYITKRWNGLYLFTAVKPVLKTVRGTGHDDAYIRYGDPIGCINVSLGCVKGVFDSAPTIPCDPVRARLFGSYESTEPTTHYIIYDHTINLHTIVCKDDSSFQLKYICKWFIKTLFGLEDFPELQPIHFSGRIL